MKIWNSGRLWQDKAHDLAELLMVHVRDGTVTIDELRDMLDAAALSSRSAAGDPLLTRAHQARARVFRAAALSVALRAFNGHLRA